MNDNLQRPRTVPWARYHLRLGSMTTELEFQLRMFRTGWTGLNVSLAAYLDLNERVAETPTDEPIDRALDDQWDDALITVWVHVYSVIESAARIGNLLSSIGKSPGVSLGDELGWSEDTFRNRGLRNALAHYDERLEDWLDKGNSNVLASAILTPSAMDSIGLTAQRLLDPTNLVVYFRDEPLPLTPLAEAATRLLRIVRDVQKPDHERTELMGRQWDELEAVLPHGWRLEGPHFNVDRREWMMFAFNDVAPRSRERQDLAVSGATEEEVIVEMATRLTEIGSEPRSN